MLRVMSVPPDDEDRAAILARRNRFVALALVGLAGASSAAACGGATQDERDASGGEADANADAKSDANQPFDGGPQPCLTPEIVDAAPAFDGPLPCLRLRPP